MKQGPLKATGQECTCHSPSRLAENKLCRGRGMQAGTWVSPMGAVREVGEAGSRCRGGGVGESAHSLLIAFGTFVTPRSPRYRPDRETLKSPPGT